MREHKQTRGRGRRGVGGEDAGRAEQTRNKCRTKRKAGASAAAATRDGNVLAPPAPHHPNTLVFTTTNHQPHNLYSYVNTASCISRISYIDGDAGILRYRGYPIEQLAERCTFTEVAHLVVYGRLPTGGELAGWEDALARHSALPPPVIGAVAALPHDAHFMGTVLTGKSKESGGVGGKNQQLFRPVRHPKPFFSPFFPPQPSTPSPPATPNKTRPSPASPSTPTAPSKTSKLPA